MLPNLALARDFEMISDMTATLEKTYFLRVDLTFTPITNTLVKSVTFISHEYSKMTNI